MAVRGQFNPPILGSVAAATNPTSGALMADSGPVDHDGNFEVRVVISQSAAAAYYLAQRNAANGADVAPSPILLYGAGAQSSQYALMFMLARGERVVVRMAANLTGQAQAALQLEAMV